jgi:hypothetical protein
VTPPGGADRSRRDARTRAPANTFVYKLVVSVAAKTASSAPVERASEPAIVPFV